MPIGHGPSLKKQYSIIPFILAYHTAGRHVRSKRSDADKTPLNGKAKSLLRQARQKWISAISCWELTKLVEKKQISFSVPLATCTRRSLNESYNINIADLSPEIAVESTQLSDFHNDPADQIIAATSRTYCRTASGAEVDLIVGDADVALEIKSSEDARDSTKCLHLFHEEHKCRKSFIVSRDPLPRKLSPKISVLPWQLFCEMLWEGEIT